MRVVRELEYEKWSFFVSNHPHGNIFQTPEMYEVYKNTKNYEPILLAALNDEDEVNGILLAVIQKEYAGFFGMFSARSIIWGGPIVKDYHDTVETIKILIEKYDTIVRNKVLYTQIRNLWDITDSQNIIENHGYLFENHLNFIIDLKKERNDLWKQVHRSMRKNIRRGEKKGLIIEEIEEESLIDIFYAFLIETYQEVGLPLADISLFRSCLAILGNKRMVKFNLAKLGDKYVGGRVCLMFGKNIYAYYVGVPMRNKSFYVNHLLNWHMIEWGSDNDFYLFDLGGAGISGEKYGVREFKQQFGGILVDFGRFEKVHKPLMLKIGMLGLRLLTIFKNK